MKIKRFLVLDGNEFVYISNSSKEALAIAAEKSSNARIHPVEIFLTDAELQLARFDKEQEKKLKDAAEHFRHWYENKYLNSFDEEDFSCTYGFPPEVIISRTKDGDKILQEFVEHFEAHHYEDNELCWGATFLIVLLRHL